VRKFSGGLAVSKRVKEDQQPCQEATESPHAPLIPVEREEDGDEVGVWGGPVEGEEEAWRGDRLVESLAVLVVSRCWSQQVRKQAGRKSRERRGEEGGFAREKI
jgi:hypothetical protein